LETDFAGQLRTVHRSFVLVAEDRLDRTFRDYHRAHRQAAAKQDEDAPRFQIPDAGHPYPRCSLPALEAGMWVRDTFPHRFAAFDMAVFEAFFSRTEDISDLHVLGRLADTCGLDGVTLAEVIREERYRERVLAEYQEALNMGIRGVPAVAMPGGPPIVGAIPYPELRRAVDAALRGHSRA
jgi:predicted DsbA family dithiol-disulfide isomerase